VSHLWQSTIFAAAVGLSTLLLRKHRARTRYWLWLAASLKFLVPFSLFIAIGSRIEWRTVQAVAVPEWVPAAQQLPHAASAIAPSGVAPVSVADVCLLLWICGLTVVLGYYGLRWRHIRAVVRQASPVKVTGVLNVMTSPTLLEPAVFGILRPVLLIPEGLMESLRPAQWETVLAHELCHVRYCDNFTAALHMIVQAVFWFHPLVWLIGARLVAERERACDEAVLQSGSEPEIYAEAILQVCRLYLGSPLPCAAGVSGANLKQRVERIMTASMGRKLSVSARTLLVIAGALTVAAPLMLGIVNAPPAHVQTASAETATHPVAWDSVKLSASPQRAPGFQGATVSESPGSLVIRYASLHWLTGRAYGRRGPFRIDGGPEWADDPLFQLTAAAKDRPPLEPWFASIGPMLQSVLRDRFALRFHYETRQLPAYTLVVESGGPKLKRTATRSCTVIHWPVGQLPPESKKPVCGTGRQALTTRLNHTDDIVGMSIAGGADNPASLVNFLSSRIGAPVLDKTGLKGLYNIHLEWNLAATEAQMRHRQPSSTDGDNPSIFAAVQNQLGLKLEPAEGPVQVLVIDHAEKPSL
jgi:uncharacterized protein (TIGR03435 family)